MTINKKPTANNVKFLIIFVFIILSFFFLWLKSIDTLYIDRGSWWYNRPTQIKSIDWDEKSGQIRVLVEYTDNGTVTLSEVYVNGTLDAEAAIDTRFLSQNQTTEILLSEVYFTKPMKITVRVVTSDEFDAVMTKVFYAIGLKQVDWDEWTGKIKVVVKNSGAEAVTLSEVYVNGILDVSALPNPKILLSDQEAVIFLSGTFMDTYTTIPIKVITLEGVTAERSAPIYGLWIQSINWNSNTGKIIAYVYSNGYEGVGNGKVSGVYVNGTLDSSATIFTHPTGDVWTVTLSNTYSKNPQQLTLKVVTLAGAYSELTMQPPNEFRN